ncbi:MAG: ferrous iron transport protein A [Clostridia bacterium]|nr:ferrous iron transport protein A [Clostridia bacterium]
MYLDQIEPGETGIVENLAWVGDVARRLRDIGLVEGMEITCVGRSPLGDPSAYFILGSVFALRRADCRRIAVRRCR